MMSAVISHLSVHFSHFNLYNLTKECFSKYNCSKTVFSGNPKFKIGTMKMYVCVCVIQTSYRKSRK